MALPIATPTADAPGAPAATLTLAAAAFRTLHLLSWLAVPLQVVIDTRYENLLAACIVLFSSSVTFLYIRLTRALRDLPLSTMAILGLCMTTQWGALIGQTLSWDSLTANLRVPVHTFGYLCLFQFVAIAAHWVSRHITFFVAARRWAANSLLKPLGIFRVPRVQAMWLMGAVGMLTMVGSSAAAGNLLGKLADAFRALAWAPFAIPLLSIRYGEAYCRLIRHVPFLVGYVLLAVLFGVATNARAVMLAGLMTGALLFVMYVLDNEAPARWRHLKYAAVAVVLGALVVQPLNYFFTAVQAARSMRDKLSSREMVKFTYETLTDPVAVRREDDRMRIEGEIGIYDEYYFKSSMLGRLVETKFHDNGFFMVDGISKAESKMVASDALDRVLSILPYPMLKSMGFERAKWVTIYSVGDVLANLRTGVPLGSFRTGSIFAQGIAVFGFWAPFIYFPVCLAMFVVWDMLSLAGRRGAAAVVSVVGMLLTYRLFAYGITSESISNLAAVVLRFQIQNVLFYALVFAATRLIWTPFDPPERRSVMFSGRLQGMRIGTGSPTVSREGAS